MTRPNILLVPEFSEVQWAIRPQLEEWAEVASYDPPGVGGEPLPDDLTPEVIAERLPEAIVERGLAEIERRGWDRFYVVADGWAIGRGARIVLRSEGTALGMALGHASLSHGVSGDRPGVNPEVYSAMTRMIGLDAPAFLRHVIPQATHDSVKEALAEEIIERVPSEFITEGWAALTADEPFGDVLSQLDCPLLFAKHQECLISTEEGFEDAVAAFPDAEIVICPDAPSVAPEFAAALKKFCSG